ncbi:MAG: pilus assembly protein PilM [Victivallaceae bacterium]|nr:pilus assembly protein PilM [Victivallaceae bacterium]
MAKENTILAIDVGGDNLKMAEFTFPAGGGVTLTKFAFQRFDEPDDDNGAAFALAYRSMLAEHGFSATHVRLSLSGRMAFSRLSKLPPLMGNTGAIGRVVEYEARQTVPYAMSEVVWDYQLLLHSWQDQRVEEQEDGTKLETTENHEEYEALFVAVKTDQITRYTDVIEDSGREILSVEIAPTALYNAARGSSQCRPDECVLMLNIGGRGSSLVIADHNRIFMRNIPIAGDSITSLVAKEYSISTEEAEELKLRHGFVALGGAYEEPESAVAATISKISRNVMTRLHGEVSRSINVWRAQHGGNAPTRVLLSGGCSTMMYMTDFFQEKLRLPVEYLNTFGAVVIGDGVDKEELQTVAPMFQELIGESFRNVTDCPIGISLIPPSIRSQRELDRKKPYLYISALLLVVCLAIFTVGVSKRMRFDQVRVERVGDSVKSTSAKSEEVKRLVKDLDGAKARYQSFRAHLDERNQWTDMLNELQGMIPNTMWLVAVEGTGPAAEPVAQPADNRPEPPQEFMFGGRRGRRQNEQQDKPQEKAPSSVLASEAVKSGEINGLRLVGYTLMTDDKDNQQEQDLIAKLKASKYFEVPSECIVKYKPNTGALNLTSFELKIKLRNPIRK